MSLLTLKADPEIDQLHYVLYRQPAETIRLVDLTAGVPQSDFMFETASVYSEQDYNNFRAIV